MSHASLDIAVPQDLRWDSEIAKAVHESLPYHVPGFLGARFGNRWVEVDFQSDLPDSDILDAVVGLIRRVSRSFRDVTERRLTSSAGLPQIVGGDPFDDLTSSGQVIATGRGKFVYRKGFLQVFQGLDRLLERYCVSQGAESELYPTTVQTKTLLDSGYLKLSPQLAYFAAPGHLDKVSLLHLGQAHITDPDRRLEVNAHLGVADQILAPTVCYHCFEARRGHPLQAGLVTAINKCHRHETVNVTSLERLTTYWMRELIAFGDDTSVQSALNDALAFTTTLLHRWNVWHEVTTANDPFFGDQGTSNRLFQAAFELKRELRLPSVSGKMMAVASFNNHQSALVQKFDISAENANSRSGCVGWGFERFIYGLYCQFGSNLVKWPDLVRRDLGLK